MRYTSRSRNPPTRDRYAIATTRDEFDDYYTGVEQDSAEPSDESARRRQLRFIAALGLCVLLAAGAAAVTGLAISATNTTAAPPPSAAAQIASARAAGFAAGRTAGYRSGVRLGLRVGLGRGRLKGYLGGWRAGRAEGFRLGQMSGYRQGYGQAVSDTSNQYQQGIQALQTQLSQTQHKLAAAVHKKPHH